MLEADIGEVPIADMAQRRRDAVEEGLGADEAMIGQQIGAISEMLAAAEADLEMERARIAEQRWAVDRPFGRHCKLRQQLLDQFGLAGAQRPALGAAVEPADGGGIVHFSFGAPLLSCFP